MYLYIYILERIGLLTLYSRICIQTIPFTKSYAPLHSLSPQMESRNLLILTFFEDKKENIFDTHE